MKINIEVFGKNNKEIDAAIEAIFTRAAKNYLNNLAESWECLDVGSKDDIAESMVEEKDKDVFVAVMDYLVQKNKKENTYE